MPVLRTQSSHGRWRSSRSAGWLATLVGVVGVLAIAAGGLLGYLSDAVFDAEEFSRRAAQSLDDPRVSSYAAARVTDQILAQYRDLTPYRPLILAGVQGMISSEPFRAVARRAIQRAHRALLARGVESAIVSIEDVGILLRAALSHQPELARRIPKSTEAALARLQRSPGARTAVRVLQVGERVRKSAMPVFFGGFLLLAFALWLAPDRRRALFHSGLALLAIGAVLLVLVQFGGWAFVLRARDPAAGAALAGLWDAFGGRLWNPALGLGGIGLVLTAAATSTLERIRLLRRARRAWRWIVDPPAAGTTRIERALLVAAIGLIAVVRPSMVSHLLVFLAGTALVFVGLEEAFRHLLPAPAAHAASARVPVRRRRSLWAGAAALAVALGLGVGVLAFFVRPWDRLADPAAIVACNGMPELCDRRLDEVVFATTHNSMASADVARWMFPQQERGIAAQLEDGVRAFLLDIHAGRSAGEYVRTEIVPGSGGRDRALAAVGPEGAQAALRIRDRIVGERLGRRALYLCHGFCELGAVPLVEVLEQMREFLVEHPHEVVILVLEDVGIPTSELVAAFVDSRLDELVYGGPAKPPWPTLRAMVEQDGRVLVLSESGHAEVPWMHPAFEVLQETPYTFRDTTEFSPEPYRGGTAGSLLLLNHWIDTMPQPRPTVAARANEYGVLMRRVEAFRRRRGRVPNLIAVDFYRTGDVLAVVRDLNQSGAATRTSIEAAAR